MDAFVVERAKDNFVVERQIAQMVKSTEFVAFFGWVGYAGKKNQDFQKYNFGAIGCTKL